MVQPIEIADTLSKTELVAKLNQKLKAASEMEQRQAETILKQKQAAESQTAGQTEKTDLVVINADREKGKEKKKFKHNEEDIGEEPLDDGEEEIPPRVDIKA
jgi:hypothetical protein